MPDASPAGCLDGQMRLTESGSGSRPLAMGLPVISTVFNGACEIMENGRHGYVLSSPADLPALAEAMRQLLDSAVRRAMSQACLALRPSLAYGHHLDKLLRIYGAITSAPAQCLEPKVPLI